MKTNVWLYYGKKLLMFILSVFVLSLIVFYMSRLSPGDPLVSYYGDRAEKMSPEEKAQTIERLGLDEPIIVQYGIWVKNAIQGDFGISYKYKTDVIEVVETRLANTVWLGGVSFICTFILALLLGVFCALRENSMIDRGICKLGIVLSCIPSFWLALILILLFSVNLGLLPSSGAYDIGKSDSLLSRFTHLILPVTSIILTHFWYYTYIIRNKLLQEIRQDYVLLAKSKGLTLSNIMWKHCLKNILPTYITLIGISVPHMIGGTYIVEVVFSYPGLGTLAVESAKYHDYNLLMIVCLLTAIVVIFFNSIAKILSEKIDPRIKHPEVRDV